MLKFHLCIFAICFAAFACSETANNDAYQSDDAETTATLAHAAQTKISVPSIQCGSCAANVEEALAELDGVAKAKVDLKGKTVLVDYDGTKLQLNQMENAIASAGYHANDTQRDPDAYADLDACCQEPADGGGHTH